MTKPTLLILFLTFVIGCNTNEDSERVINTETLIPNKYAAGFSIYKTEGGLVYKVFNPQTEALIDSFFIADTFSFNKSIVFSATYISFLAKINELNTIKGVTYSGGIFNTDIKNKLATREIIDIGSDNEPNKELILEINPDVIFSFPNNNNLAWLNQFNIKNISVTEYLESHPLGQAEWIRFFGYLFHKEKLADSIFNAIESDYNKLAEQQLNKTNKPIVLGGELYDDSWTLPGGKSFTSKLISDAGGEFLSFGDSSTGSYKIDYEVILNNKKDINFWIFPTYDYNTITKEYLLQKNPKYKFLSIIETNHIAVCNTAKSPYFEQGIVEPNVILKDLINIFNNRADTNTYFKLIN
jgi:iron complex transport system substrate-binding protein